MKKLLSITMAFIMIATTLFALPFTAQARQIENINLTITGMNGNGLKPNEAPKNPANTFLCIDSEGTIWSIYSSSAWYTTSGTKITSSDTISKYSNYILHLVVSHPDVYYEDDICVEDVESITFNGVEIKYNNSGKEETSIGYRRGELGGSIYINVKFSYCNFTQSDLSSLSGFYSIGETIPVEVGAPEAGKHINWGGTYQTGAGSQSLSFSNPYSAQTSFVMPSSDMPVNVSYSYADHTPKVVSSAVPATCSKTGLTESSKCSVCGETITAQKTIAKISSVNLSATVYNYDGKVKTPAVTVKDSKGKVLKKGTDYTVSYASGRKLVGKYAVKITFKGNYSGTKTLYFTIRPKNTTFSLASGKKAFTAKIKKYTTQTTGYQIQYSTNAKFTSAKTVAMKNTTTSKTISKLTGGKKYYVRVRTYKTVKINGKNTNIYSAWSSAKAVTTKK